MKIAVTSRGRTLEDQVEPRFGRAGLFLIVDTETWDVEVVDNSANQAAGRGAGIQAARTVADRGAQAVITGHCGPNAFQTLSAAGLAVVVDARGTVRSAVERFLEGDLQSTDSADVQGHWR
jgi:predicted Fe-Mo cluster-binding NifX family protein